MKIRGLCEKNVIYFDNIGYGLRNYDNEVLTLEETEAYEFFSQKIQTYGTENVFADFYFFTLEQEVQEKIRELLTEEELAYLEILRPVKVETEKHLVFMVEDVLLRIIVKLNAREMLFSTIYFQGIEELAPETYWGNYNKEYVKFYL